MDPAFVARFVATVDDSASRLLALSDAAAATPRAPGKWSPKEVRVQCYGDERWAALVDAWRQANYRIAAIMRAAPPQQIDRPRRRHNLDAIAFVPPASPSDATLGYFMRDYVAHLEHHLRQIFG